jgi:outer membrane lipoprotein carrier protein
MIAIHQHSASESLADQLSSFRSYSASFKQQTYSDHRLIQTASGRLWILRPGKFRWQVLSPSKQLLVINGRTFWNYDEDLAQATMRLLSTHESINAASLLSGSAESLLAAFRVKRIPSKQPLTEYQLQPKDPKSGSFSQITLTFNKDKFSAMQTKNKIGQDTIFSFSKIQLNPGLSKTLFNFKPPRGVTVLK